jgi:aspartyl-tRNA(Asn)/glutamyl-tRNA(Gln) amidotransferase subunit B
VERAAEYEFRRQVELLESGERVVQETRGWDDAKQKTTSQRSKEDAQDYRYMPDADIPPIVLTDEEIESIQQTVPNLPSYYREAWKSIGFDSTVENALLLSKESAELFERVRQKAGDRIAKRIGFWFLKSIVENIDEDSDVQKNSEPIPDEYFITLSEMVENSELNSNAGDSIFAEMMRTSKNPKQIAEEMNLTQMSDVGEISTIVDAVLSDPASMRAVEDLKKGNDKVIGFLVGQVMRKSAGKANPALVQKLIREKVETEK